MSKWRKGVCIVLFPITIWYAVAIVIRNLMFSLGLKKQVSPPVTTIAVGNLNVGGSGKTPMADYLLQRFGRQQPTALVSRGYGRNTRGCVMVEGTPDASRVGDEVAMLARRHPEVQMCVCERRLTAIETLLRQEVPPQLVVLDDAFQHRYVRPTINILLTEFSHPFSSDCILPYGNLREFRSAKDRANIIVVTKCPEKLSPIDRENMISSLNVMHYQTIFFSYLHYGTPYRLGVLPRQSLTEASLRAMDQVLLLTGIAHPQPLVTYLSTLTQVRHKVYRDHHAFTRQDIQDIVEEYNHMEGARKCIITTEKDAVRLQNDTLLSLPVYVQPVEMRFCDEGNDNTIDFDATIGEIIKENILFQRKLQSSSVLHFYDRR